MKKRKIIIFICADVLLAAGAVACVFSAPHNKKGAPAVSKNTENLMEEDPFEVDQKEEEIISNSVDPGADINSGGGNIISGNSDEMTLQYDGTPVVIEYEFMSRHPCVMGLMIYVNGLLQPYTVSGEETTMYAVQMGENDTKRFTLEFTPVCGKAGQELVIEFPNFYNAKVMELKGGANTFGNSHTVSQSMPWKLKLNADSPEVAYDISDSYEIQAFTEEDQEKFIQMDMYGITSNRLEAGKKCEIELSRDGERLEEKSVFQENEPEELSLRLYGYLTGKYRVSLYGDFQRIPINGHDYAEVVVEKDAYTTIPFSIDLKEVKAKNLFVIAAPMDDGNFIVKSPTIYLGRE